MSLTVAVCITTHNRRDELTRTLAALATLNPPPDEILIAVDGCQDGTLELLRDKYPQARLLIHEQAQGSIPSRNELAAACRGDIFLSLDDDSYPLETDCIARLRDLFTARPRLAVASFPQRSDEFPASLTATDFGPSQFVGSYANSGAAIRRSVFEQLGGYPGFFFHAYEEPDFALRCAAAGWQVWHEVSITIRHHFTGAQRNEIRTHQRHSRNEFWSVLLRCPAPQCLGVALFRLVRQFGYAGKRGLDWVVREPAWWLAALKGVSRCLAQRQPLPWEKYRAWMELVRTPLASEAEWNAKFGAEAS
ncbi:glycosyl transferase family 2 [Chthoniobacter flavus Ellin428]|uniref:Glycosyl transferase family 2 n=1 Tax=Chthoniobacter flavus Ellin428 TaxID=497964 RepID=B4D5E9_9BACT|nr:glycosyltransferase family A protein [Chthoniobacter flavus]EDY18354.1 glycosyl transferase family 2 [Chthoniobacter flavus Ellin428]TCO91376.1 GT2 family glycosyltransferase [Chthoniobacter flavus]